MRTVVSCLVLALAVVAAPAGAQSDDEAVADLLATEFEEVFPPETAVIAGACFSERFTDEEVDAMLSAEDVMARQAIIDGMAEREAALICLAALLE